MRKALLLLVSIWLLLSVPALAQAKFDGTWVGTSGPPTLTVVVTGQKAKLTLACNNSKFNFDIAVSPEGAIDSILSTQGMARRRVNGTLPAITVGAGGSCGGGTVTLKR